VIDFYSAGQVKITRGNVHDRYREPLSLRV
jgi:hypothetical protein